MKSQKQLSIQEPVCFKCLNYAFFYYQRHHNAFRRENDYNSFDIYYNACGKTI